MTDCIIELCWLIYRQFQIADYYGLVFIDVLYNKRVLEKGSASFVLNRSDSEATWKIYSIKSSLTKCHFRWLTPIAYVELDAIFSSRPEAYTYCTIHSLTIVAIWYQIHFVQIGDKTGRMSLIRSAGIKADQIAMAFFWGQKLHKYIVRLSQK